MAGARNIINVFRDVRILWLLLYLGDGEKWVSLSRTLLNSGAKQKKLEKTPKLLLQFAIFKNKMLFYINLNMLSNSNY